MKLTDTQLVLLSAASQREDGGVEIGPALKGSASRKVLGELLTEHLIEEIPVKGSLPGWRRDEDKGALALRITDHGLAAIGANQDAGVAILVFSQIFCGRVAVWILSVLRHKDRSRGKSGNPDTGGRPIQIKSPTASEASTHSPRIGRRISAGRNLCERFRVGGRRWTNSLSAEHRRRHGLRRFAAD